MTEETLFHLALQESISERAAFLEKMCGGDDALCGNASPCCCTRPTTPTTFSTNRR